MFMKPKAEHLSFEARLERRQVSAFSSTKATDPRPLEAAYNCRSGNLSQTKMPTPVRLLPMTP
jgi:hypothetical protein